MHFGLHPAADEGPVEGDGVVRNHRFVVTAQQEHCLGHSFVHLPGGRVAFAQCLLFAAVPEKVLPGPDAGILHRDDRVDQDGEVGARLPARVFRDECRGEVASRRESDNSYAAGIDVPLRGVAADDAHRLLAVLERNPGMAVRHPVFEDHCGDAVFVEPLGGLVTFVCDADFLVTPARHDQHGLSRGAGRIGEIYQQFGVADPDVVALVVHAFGLLFQTALRRGSLREEFDAQRLGRLRHGDGQQ